MARIQLQLSIVAALAAGVLVMTGTAHADLDVSYSEAPPQRAPTGLYFGASMGRGAMGVTCDGCRSRPDLDEALSVTAMAGLRLGSRLGVFGEYWLTRWHDRDGTWFDQQGAQTVTQSIASGGVQLWATRRLWLRAQIGYGRHQTTADYGERVTADVDGALERAASESVEPPMSLGASNAMATAVTAGFDIVHTPGFSMSAELRHGRTRADSKSRSIDVTAISVGLSWF